MPDPTTALTPVAEDGDERSQPSVEVRALRRTMALVALVVGLAALAGIGSTAAVGAQVTADEPYYLMTAGSLFHRQDLDIGPDLRDHSYRAYHRATLPQQTAPLPGGQRLSPHDPLLPAILAVPFGLGGWFGAKLAMVAMAAALAALLVWTATVRFGVPLGVAGVVVAGFGVVPPLAAYGTQIYPELPAALAVTAAVAALMGPADRRCTATWVVAVAALPWLAVKYAPVALALALVGLFALAQARARRGLLVGAVVGLGLAAVAFGAFHQAVYGGWTVYAAGNHFGGGELTVMGESPDYASRSQRLVNLLTDHDFGLLAWAPAFLAAVPAAAALVRRRPKGWLALGLPLGAGWLNATFVALTMHGWWWPGRQVVVVVPLIVLSVAWWFGTVLRWERVRPWFLAASGFGLLAWLWLQVEVARGTSTIIIDFASTTNPLSKAWRLLLPDGRVLAAVDDVRLVGWMAALAALAAWSWRRAGAAEPS
ncbi:hypothetical protein KSP35_11660 [Aquihabitans sp. G128]|uniref:hypothetical protein n=1 Tax=Aquihabitans sp. G128 TaxID=2849779 RepID=UPI001C233515|nr:hypothetical protein [Aquihabitans sp. G128]QXC63382.1 hypothetical protein KSP35_11660 [Aquihabitans sp. G128]